MNRTSVFCIAFSHLQADQMVQRLRAAAFSIHDISVISARGPMIAALGDLKRGLLDQGVPTKKARLFEEGLKDGHTLVSVQADGDEEMARAREVLTKTGGSAVCSTEKNFQSSQWVAATGVTEQSESRRLTLA